MTPLPAAVAQELDRLLDQLTGPRWLEWTPEVHSARVRIHEYVAGLLAQQQGEKK